jgi:hypothetical protein
MVCPDVRTLSFYSIHTYEPPMNLNLSQLKTFRDNLTAAATHLTSALKLLAPEIIVGPYLPAPAAALPDLPAPARPAAAAKAAKGRGKVGRPARVPRGAAEPVAETKRLGSGRSVLRASVVDWIARWEGEFTAKDLPPVLREDPTRTSKLLSNLQYKGLLKKGGQRNSYLGGGKSSRPTGALMTRQPAGRLGLHRAAIESMALRLGPKSKWSASEMETFIRREQPDLVSTPAKCSDLRVRLIDMASEGFLMREGIGSLATYQLGPKLSRRDVPTGNGEPPLQVRVPRDADAGKDGE